MSRRFSNKATWDRFVFLDEDLAFDCANISLLLISITLV